MHTESPNSVRLLLCERLEEFATDTNLRCHVPLQAWAAKAWGASKAHKPGRVSSTRATLATSRFGAHSP